ncbi:MAG: helix-turn-helix domain-containing protein [Halobacteria archaeon]
MARSIVEQLKKTLKCEDLLACIYDLKQLDIAIYKCLLEKGGMKVDELSEYVKREKSTTYRSLQNLITHGLVFRETHSIENGGYYYTYHPNDPSRIYRDIKRYIDEWYAKMNLLLQEFQLDFLQERKFT